MADPKSDTVKKLEWKLQKLNDKHESYTKVLEKEISSRDKQVESLKSVIKSLQGDLDTAHKDKTDLVSRVKSCEREKMELLQALDSYKSQVKGLKTAQTELEHKMASMHESFRKSLMDHSRKHEDKISSLQADFKTKMVQNQKEKEKVCQELVGKHHLKAEEMKKHFHELEDKYKALTANMEKLRAEHGMALEEHKKALEKERFDQGVKSKKMVLDNEEMADKNKKLEKKVDNSRKRISKLEEDILDQNKIVAEKNHIINALKREKKEEHEKFKEDVQRNAVLEGKIEVATNKILTLRDNYRAEKEAHKSTTNELNMANRSIANLTEKVTFLEFQVKSHKPNLKKMEEKIKDKDTYILRFKEDLQSSMDFLHEPAKLRRTLIQLKRRYLDEDLPVDERDELISCLKKKFEHCDNINKSLYNQVVRAKEEVQRKCEKEVGKMTYLVKVCNEKEREVFKLKTQLKETALQLQRATRPPLKTIQSIIKTTILEEPKWAHPSLETKSPSLHQEEETPDTPWKLRARTL